MAPRLAYVETYGCQMNVADSEMIMGLLQAAGYERTPDAAQADVILINTCAVREKAVDRIMGRAAVLAQHKSAARPVVLGILGCVAEHMREQLRDKAPFVDLVVGPDAYRRLPEHIDKALAGQTLQDTALDSHETYAGLDPARDESGIIGRIAIQRGCDRFCSFCVVPYTRGRERGTAPDEILRQARALADAGVKEIQLLGQTVNSYRCGDTDFAGLLRALDQVPGVERYRFMSPYPLDFSADVMAVMAASPRMCKHVHLPLQSASDTVLGRMRRGYDFAQYRDLVVALRAAMPGIAITTDLLVGFCGETDDEFQAILRAIEELRFDHAFMFAYSERAGTRAAREMPDDVPAEVKQERLAKIIAAQRQVTGQIHAALVGTRQRVLVETTARRSSNQLLGRTDTCRSVILPAASGVLLGALVDVIIERANAATLFGRVA
jgi:tRNA-2-methylthio-N6-dimethylallyladenosine synthase